MTAPISPTGMVGQEATAAEQSRMELQARLNGLGGLNGRQLPPEVKAKKLREACEGFESIFIQKMWQEMRNAVPKTGILQGREERFWQDMYDQELSKSMTRAGGIGIADMMYEQLSRNLVSASRSAAGAVTGAAFTPSAAPLVAESETADLLDPPAPASAASIYESEAPETGAASGGPAQPVAAQSPKDAPAQTASTQPVQTAQAAAPVAPQPVNVHYSPAGNTAHGEPRHKTADLNQASGLLMAQQAMRDAGDKLGSRAVRPSTRARRQREEKAVAQTVEQPQAVAQPASGISQNGMQPGSPEALRAAVEKARNGYIEQDQTQAAINLHNLVASAQARNAMPQAEQQMAEAEPVVRRVRKTTNIPQNNSRKQVKRNSQAIRMLNVDNVGVNSRQGQGLAAYHAQQDAVSGADRQTQSAAESMAPTVPDASRIPPLTAASQKNTQAATPAGNFAIPPLTAAGSRG